MSVVEVETDTVRVRVAGPRLVTLHVQPHAREHMRLPWLAVYPGLWIAPPSFAPTDGGHVLWKDGG